MSRTMINVVFDWDRGTEWTFYDGSNLRRARRSDFVQPSFWSQFSGLTVGVEKAHMTPRNDQSVAQIYDRDELDMISRAVLDTEVSVFLIPEAQSFRARQLCGMGDDRSRITEAYKRLFDAHPEITLQRFPFNENESRKAALLQIKRDSNWILNKLRPDYEDVLVDCARDMVSWGMIRLSPQAIKHMEIERKRGGQVDFNNTAVMSIFSVVRDRSGDLRMHGGAFVGVDTIMRVLTQNPYKGKKSGTARSNLMLHWQQKRVLKDLPREEWKAPRAEARRVLKEMIKLFRDAPRRPLEHQTELFK